MFTQSALSEFHYELIYEVYGGRLIIRVFFSCVESRKKNLDEMESSFGGRQTRQRTRNIYRLLSPTVP